MLKLLKYEYRKDALMYIIVFGILTALELYLAGSILAKSETNIAISMVLFLLCGWAGVLFLMVVGVISYARELHSKSSYMTFMTPVSSYQIVGSKYLALFIATVLATAVYGAFIYIDFLIAVNRYSDMENIIEAIDQFLTLSGNGLSEIFASFAALIFSVWMNIIVTVSYAFLAITLSSTILSNKKGKGWLSVGLFVAIRIVTSVILAFIPNFDFGDTILQMILGQWLKYAFELVMIIGTYFGVSILLEKKVSL